MSAFVVLFGSHAEGDVSQEDDHDQGWSWPRSAGMGDRDADHAVAAALGSVAALLSRSFLL